MVRQGSCCTAPTTTISPTSQTVCAGSTATIGVTSSAATPNYTWQASANGSSGWAAVANNTPAGATYTGGSNATLTITAGATYYYRCLVADGTSTCIATSSTSSLVVNTAPSVTTPTLSSATTCEGATSATVKINATGSSSFTYQWQVSTGSGYSNVGGAAYSGGTTNTLTIGNSITAGTYSFQCIVTNACGSATSTVSSHTVVALPSAPPTPTASSNPACAPLILNAMTSTVTGVTWFWEGVNGPAPAGVSTSSPTTSDYSVTTTNTYFQTLTIWVRAQTNGSGCWSATSTSISVVVQNTMSITTQPTSTAVIPGASVSFTCAVSQPTSTVYQWQQNCGSGWSNVTNGGIYAGATSSVLTINPTSDALNGCQYRNITTGACNTLTSSIATLTVANTSCFTDDFSGSLSQWSNTANWIIAAGEMKHNNTVAATDYFYHDLSPQDLSTCDYEWKVSVRGTYSPSTNNKFAYSLLNTNSNITSGNGYAVGINMNGSTDKLQLYSCSGGVYTSVITSTLSWTSTSNLDIRVTRTASGTWELFYNSISAGTASDVTYTSGQYMGGIFICSVSNVKKMFFDNVSICSSCSASTNTISTGTTSATTYNLPDCVTGAIGSVDFTSVGTFSTGNVYSVQLSNSSGSFAAPITIGTTTSTSNSGTITFTIPAGTAAGTNYKVRVVSDNPITFGSASAIFTITTSCTPPPANSCPYISAALINGCSGSCNTEGSNEVVFLNSGSYGITVNNTDIKITYDGTNFTNSFESNSSVINSVVSNMNSNSSYTTTPLFVGVPSGGTIPANSSFMILNDNSCFDNNWNAFCGSGPIYVIISTDADWAGANNATTGWFSNSGSAGSTKVFTTNFTSLSSTCTAVNYIYEPNLLPSGDGASVTFTPTGGYPTAYYAGSSSCSVPLALLPIELIDFYGVYDGGVNELVWKVAEEISVSNYFVEKSRDGFNFFPFVMIPVNENSHESKIYTSIDNSPYDDITYYRLSSQDKEGTLKYHKIIAVTDDDTKELIYDYYQLHDDLIIEFKNVVPKNAALSLYDIAGQKISEGYVEERITKMPITYLSSGVYFIRITTPYKTKNFKLIIQK